MSRSPATITNGIPNTEMMPFKEQLTEPQIWQLVAYLKTQARKPQGEADVRSRSRRAGHQDREADLQDRDRRARTRDAVGPRVPAGRPPADHRASRPPAHRREREAAAGTGEGHADGLGAAGRRTVRRRGPPAVREERLDLSVRTPSRVRTTRRRRRRPRRPRRACCRGRGGQRCPAARQARCERRRVARPGRRPAQRRRAAHRRTPRTR